MIAGPPLYALESEPRVIHAEGVHKSYRRGNTNTPVLRGVDLDVCRGQCVYLAGPSGSGKTTLLSILGCILSPDRGRVKILGEDLDDLHPAERIQLRRDRLGFVFQRFQLVRGLTALENVRVPLALRGTAPERPDAAPWNCSTPSGWPTSTRPTLPNSAPASASASPSPGRWPTIPI